MMFSRQGGYYFTLTVFQVSTRDTEDYVHYQHYWRLASSI